LIGRAEDMQIIRGLHNLKPAHRGCVATIGNFDGVHLGHQAVFQNLIARGRALGLPGTVITFEPQPQEYFLPERAPARLTRLREKLTAMQAAGVDRVLLLGFNARLALLRADAFIEQILVQGLGVRLLFVGDDFRFGHSRHGDFHLLQERGARHGFVVEDMRTVRLAEDRVSSTRVREALRQGDLAVATHLLGHPYRLCGRIGHGEKRGRTLGFPTANLDLHRRVSPVRGVFAVQVRHIGGQIQPGVANIGDRPTVAGDRRFLLEAHLFDFTGNLYGTYVAVELVHKLRDERRFASFEDLRRQIVQDAEQARDLLAVARLKA
jgi:riboflavin kinase / FMN adenylyltransferase